MKSSSIIFILISIISIFTIACGDTTNTDESIELPKCSLENLNGKCSDSNEVCANGICVLKDSICAPSCNSEQVCDNGICIAKENNSCDPACTEEQVCDDGICVLIEKDFCEPQCSSSQTCIKDTCFDLIKEVDCLDHAPSNASLVNNPKEKVIVGWNIETEEWGEADDCAWICNTGYTENSGACIDINECDIDNGECSQNCINTIGSYECSCEDGYRLNSDNFSCDDINSVKLITFNLALGAKRCFSTNPTTGDPCPNDCNLDCDSDENSCVKQLLKTDDSIQEIATYLHNQFEENEYGIIFLQEVNTSLNGVNSLQVITDELGGSWDYTFYSPMGNTYGIAIISNIIHTKQQLWSLPVPSGQEERGAIALKMKLDGKFAWVVNAHLGLTNTDRVAQIEEIKNKYLTFSTTTPVLIAGDFNILDIYNHGEGVSISSDDIIHYGNTIQKLLDTGLKKLNFKDSEDRKYSFHSWNSVTKGRTIDYILWLDRDDRTSPEMNTLRPGPYSTSAENAFCSEYNSSTRYLSDHNGLVIKYDIFNH